ncbi:MAG: 2-oxoacid:acceptor oxidoreductase subunit alpha [Candidatus Odinarchaeum yellowstonii]|uniref:2-oxoacid:acceptor oxidoreductase subunit alpha n=1 Tax=Odinarchaeota yellowstonii (strain LCB_4) TaxID=1841599 RepID=A0AAF0D2Y3_ODILC|nr:MAG: 2-oxoacid:acceptor oxidoreductase subunit alpha [Candidatus Odinarchaeum yellowstonii]
MSNNLFTTPQKDVSIVLCGEAGQGIQTLEFFLTRIFKISGYHVYATKEYMSRIRGGSNSTQIRVSSDYVRAPVKRMDIFIPLDGKALKHLEKHITSNTVIIGDKANLKTELKLYDIPLTKISTEIGGKIYENMIAVGVISKLFKVNLQTLEDYLKNYFAKKGTEIVEKNIKAVKAGYDEAERLFKNSEINVIKNPDVKDHIVLNGAEAVALGAIAGGCNFIAAYPMSPSTNVFVFLAQHASTFNIIVEQAEDEISAINMAEGAWYAGARAMVSTSGGGFSLMTEGLSLAGMIESPLVIHLAQRPGPATGLPTRTEQADLNLALYAGHGEFPRAVFTPGSIEDAFYLTQKAFNLADKFQIPVFVLTDQYLIDSYYDIPELNLSELNIEKHVIKTSRDYKRYLLTASGVSPRGIPGYGDGVVVVDSDEHDEEGHITEDLDLRTKMVDKRLRKIKLIEKETLPPELHGAEQYKYLLIGWGSTYNSIIEALKNLNRKDAALLFFKQAYPVHSITSKYLEKAEKIIFIENNATCQFGRLIQQATGYKSENRILKYNGLPFTVEELVEKIEEIIGA